MNRRKNRSQNRKKTFAVKLLLQMSILQLVYVFLFMRLHLLFCLLF